MTQAFDEVQYSLVDHAFSQRVNKFHHRGLMDAKAVRDRLELPTAAELVQCYIATRISKGIAGRTVMSPGLITSFISSHQFCKRSATHPEMLFSFRVKETPAAPSPTSTDCARASFCW